jgi:hypothetical protein
MMAGGSDRAWSTFILKLASFLFSLNLLQLGFGSYVGLFYQCFAVLGSMRSFNLMAAWSESIPFPTLFASRMFSLGKEAEIRK